MFCKTMRYQIHKTVVGIVKFKRGDFFIPWSNAYNAIIKNDLFRSFYLGVAYCNPWINKTEHSW